jgi:fibronectin-binding autotransporter adhesin
MRPKAHRHFLAAASLLVYSASLTHAATFTWDGGAGGTGTVLNTDANWNPDGPITAAPTFSWNGTVAGPLALTINNNFGPTGLTNGMIWSVAATQTSALTVTNSSAGVARNLYFMSGNSLNIASGAGAFTLGGSGDAMQIRLSNGTNNYNFINNSANKATFGSNVSFNRDTATNTSLIFNAAVGDIDVLGNILVLGTGSVAKDGPGTLTLGGANTFTGSLLVRGGTVVFSALNNLGAVASTSSIRLGQQANSGTLLFNGASDVTINRQINIGNGATATDDGSSTIQNDSATGALTFGNATFNVAGTADISRSLTLRGTNTGNNLISGSIVDNLTANGTVSLIKRDAGTWNLTGENTFSRGLQIWEGVLEFDGNGSLGAQTIQTRIGRLSTDGTLRHTGASNTIVTGQVQVGFGAGGTGNATIESTGVGTLSFNNATFNNAEGGANAHRTLTLGGNNTGANTISGAIVNNNDTTARVAITKTGAGTWVLGGTNAYTGVTSVTSGTLQVDGSIAAGSQVDVGTAGTLSGTGTINGSATLTGSGIINKSSGTIAGTLGVTGGNWNGNGAVTGAVTASSGAFNIGSGANLTANGGLNVTGGTIAAGSSTGTITGSVNYTSASNSTFQGVIAGSGKTLTMNNSAATLTLTGTNTYNGTTTVSAGKLNIGSGGSISSATSISANGTLEISTGGSVSTPGDLSIASAGTLKLAGGSISANGGANYILNSGTYDVNGQTVALTSYEASLMNANSKLQNSSATAATILGWNGAANKNTVWINSTGVSIETVGDLDIQSIVTHGASNNGFTKTGAGMLTLSSIGNDLGTGDVAVSAGTLYLSGNLGAGSVDVGSSGTIGGDGTLTGNLAFLAGADFLFDPLTTLTVNDGTSASTISFAGFSITDLAGLTNAVANNTYILMDGTATFDFTNVSNFGSGNAYALGLGKSAYFQTDINNSSLNLVVIPEPRAALLGGLGLLALLRRRRN